MKIYFGNEYEIPDFKKIILLIAISSSAGDPQLLDRVKLLLEQGADINAQTPEGDTALILAGWLTSNLALVQYLAEQGANVNLPNRNGDTPLIDAAYKGKNELPLTLEVESLSLLGVCVSEVSGPSCLPPPEGAGV